MEQPYGNRADHLEWCKKRALEYVDCNDLTNAFASMASDMRKHDELKDHSGINLGLGLMLTGSLNTTEAMREFIEGFN